MLSDIFISVIYQPFLNLLVFLYWLLDIVTFGNADMGIAVIILTIFIRVLLLPLSLAGDRSEKERREIASQIKEIDERFATDPIKQEKYKKKVMRSNKRVLLAELFNLFIQVTIALMLWKIFNTGLQGADLDLIYPFMPEVDQPFNLIFLGRYDLGHTSFTLNLLQSFLIFLMETVSIFTSPYPVSKKDVVRLQLVLPLVSFVIFMNLPSGKKLFVITSLIFSILLTLGKFIYRKIKSFGKKDEDFSEETTESDIVVETK